MSDCCGADHSNFLKIMFGRDINRVYDLSSVEIFSVAFVTIAVLKFFTFYFQKKRNGKMVRDFCFHLIRMYVC
jgi:hypothetical protein